MIQNLVLLTRPSLECLPLAGALHRAGIASMVEPMLEILYRTPEKTGPKKVCFSGVILTSQHGLKGMLRCFPHVPRKTPVYCVGSVTAQHALHAGFKNVHVAAGAAVHLQQLIQGQMRAQAMSAEAPLFYPRGQEIRLNLKDQLATQGIVVEECIVYEAKPVAALSEHLLDTIRKGAVKVVALYSKRTAETFLKLIKEAGYAPFQGVVLVASEDIASLFRGGHSGSIVFIDPEDIDTVVKACVNLGLSIAHTDVRVS